MKIAYPVTDYIRASTMTLVGDMVRRDDAAPARIPRPANPSFLRGFPANPYPQWQAVDSALGAYLKSQGPVTWPIFEALALRDTGIFIGNSMRNSGGPQVITGIGFESSVVIFLFGDTTAGNINLGVGFDNGTIGMCICLETDGALQELATNRSIRLNRGAGDQLTGYITAIGANGFTITWTLSGSCAVDFAYLCLP